MEIVSQLRSVTLEGERKSHIAHAITGYSCRYSMQSMRGLNRDVDNGGSGGKYSVVNSIFLAEKPLTVLKIHKNGFF